MLGTFYYRSSIWKCICQLTSLNGLKTEHERRVEQWRPPERKKINNSFAVFNICQNLLFRIQPQKLEYIRWFQKLGSGNFKISIRILFCLCWISKSWVLCNCRRKKKSFDCVVEVRISPYQFGPLNRVSVARKMTENRSFTPALTRLIFAVAITWAFKSP